MLFLHRKVVALALSLFAAATWGENAGFVLPFGGEPGAALPHAYDYGKAPQTEGAYAMRIPNVDPEVAKVLHDTELWVDAREKRVLAVRAARAFRASGECELGQKVLAAKVARVLPAPFTGQGPWQYQADDGSVVGGAWCHTARHLPFTTLYLDLRVTAVELPLP